MITHLKAVMSGLATAALLILTLSLPMAASAETTTGSLQKTCSGAASQTEYCKNYQQQASENRIIGPNGIITKIAKLFVFLAAAVSVVMIVIGGLRYVLSGGDSNATKGAKDTIMYAVIGLVVAIFSQVIVTFVLARL